MTTQVRKGYLAGAAYAGMFVFGIVMALLGAILPPLSERIRFDLARAGNLFLTMNFAMLASMLGLGPVMDRFGKRLVLAGGSLSVAIAFLLMAAASSYRDLLVSVLLLGIGGGALNGATNTLIADLHVDPSRKSSALNLLGVFFGFGALFLPFVIGSLFEELGLVSILYSAALLSLMLAILFLALAFPQPKRCHSLFPAGIGLSESARNPLVLLLGSLLFFQSGNEFIMGGYASTYLTRRLDASISVASYVLAAYWGSIMLGRVISSRLVLQVKGPRLVLASALGSGIGATLLIAASTERIAALAIVVIGLSFSSIFPTTLGFAASRFEARSGTVLGILFAMALTGGMTLPWAVGQIAEAYGLGSALTLVVANSLMIFSIQLLILRFQRKD